MSYCRFSDDNYRCDVYVFATENGFETHVAANRIALPEGVIVPSFADLASGTISPEDFQKADRAFRASLKLAPRTAVEHPEAGAWFTHATPGECADNLARLAAEGFHIPAGVIDTLRAEQTERMG